MVDGCQSLVGLVGRSSLIVTMIGGTIVPGDAGFDLDRIPLLDTRKVPVCRSH